LHIIKTFVVYIVHLLMSPLRIPYTQMVISYLSGRLAISVTYCRSLSRPESDSSRLRIRHRQNDDQCMNHQRTTATNTLQYIHRNVNDKSAYEKSKTT